MLLPVEMPDAAGAVLTQVVPLLVKTLPLVPGATNCTASVPLPSTTLFKVNDVRPVPPLAAFSVPAKVMVPDPVTGPPDVVSPVVPPDTSTELTLAAVYVVEMTLPCQVPVAMVPKVVMLVLPAVGDAPKVL